MKSFDVYFQKAQVPNWKPFYIDYASMKRCLKKFRKRRIRLLQGELQWSSELAIMETNASTRNQTGKIGSVRPVDREDHSNSMVFGGYTLQGSDEIGFGINSNVIETPESRLSQFEHDEYMHLLQTELEKCRSTYQSKWVDLKAASFEHPKEEEISILELYGFAVVNVCALRQLILKYNAHTRMYQGSRFLSEWEILQTEGTWTVEDVRKMDFNSRRRVVGNPIGSLKPLQDHMMSMPSYWQPSRGACDLKDRADELENLLDKTSWKQEIRQSPNRRERILQTTRSLFTMGSAQMGISMEPRFLYPQVRGFRKEMKALVVWRESIMSDVTAGDDDADSVVGAMDPKNVWPLILNLVSCYLFMMNNYIIEPSSAYYANALGSSDALSGIMMGMAPWFALISSVGYSIWTNTSYKQPILFAGTLMVIGNTLYGAASSYQSMEMCLIGRAISGLGAPRIINRRYVADSTPFKLRTMSSAAFALTTALGAASGPGVAILLDMIPEFQFTLPILGVQTFNGMTGPGFVMAVLWFLFAIAILISFKEPNRSGLDELKQREALAKANEAGQKALKEPLQPDGLQNEGVHGVPTGDYYDDDASIGSLSVDSSYRREEHEYSKHSPLYCIKNMTRATALCMGLIFMKRIALESIVGSTSVITKNRYAWSIKNVGTLHLVNGIIVIPVSIFAGWLSQYREDRFLAMWFMGITSFGMLIMTDPSDFVDTDTYETYNYDSDFSIGPAQYVVGSLIAFSGVEACESFVASLMSKCVPSALAVGTFNSGLLATLVGTGGRAVGDLFITAMGLISIRNLLNLLIVPGLSLMLLSMFLLWRNYAIVAV